MRYTVLLTPRACARVRAVIGDAGLARFLPDAAALIAEMRSPVGECIVVDPALLTPVAAEAIASRLMSRPRLVVAYTAVSGASLQSSVILAQCTPARFVFRGTPNERSALERALLLTQDTTLGRAIASLLSDQLAKLPPGIRERLTRMLRDGDGPQSPDALAASGSIPRRSLDRCLAEAGLTTAHRFIEGIRVISVFRALVTSALPFDQVATMLGYRSRKAFDLKLHEFLDTTPKRIRDNPPDISMAAQTISYRLTSTYLPGQQFDDGEPDRPRKAGGPQLTLLKSAKDNRRHSRRTASGEV